jgi:hypothetical protein
MRYIRREGQNEAAILFAEREARMPFCKLPLGFRSAFQVAHKVCIHDWHNFSCANRVRLRLSTFFAIDASSLSASRLMKFSITL